MNISLILIYGHVAGGFVALLSGAAALSFQKGSPAHRTTGSIFFISMLIMSGFGAILAYKKLEMISLLNGILTFYLVTTAWVTVKRKGRVINLFDICALIVVLATAFGLFYFGIEAEKVKTGFPPAIYYFSGAVATIAAVMDAIAIIRRGVSGRQRIIRHLWRMCFAMYIATSSLFLGQQQIFPEFIRETNMLFVPVVLVIVAMIYWLCRVLFTNWYKNA